MLHISRRARLLLDLLFGAGVLLALAWSIALVGQLPTSQLWILRLAVLAAIAAWVLWRRERGHGGRAAPLLLTGAALIATVASDGPGTLLLLFVCLTVLIVEQGALTGLLASLALVVSLALVMATAYHQSATSVATQSVGILIMLTVGITLAQLLRETDQARRENARLLAELRGSLDSEKDHVLAQERARAARDLHDGLGHQLTAVSMGLDYATRMRARDPSLAWAEVERARELTGVALDRMRVWVRALDPVSVGALTGTAALETVAEAFRGTGLDVAVRTSGTERDLDRESALFCLRVVQEGLTNALRHAGATRVELQVDHAPGRVVTVGTRSRGDAGALPDGSLTLTLVDDGSPPMTASTPPTGYGLRSLAERAERLGGTVDAGWTDRGFRLCVRLPVPSVGYPS